MNIFAAVRAARRKRRLAVALARLSNRQPLTPAQADLIVAAIERNQTKKEIA